MYKMHGTSVKMFIIIFIICGVQVQMFIIIYIRLTVLVWNVYNNIYKMYIPSVKMFIIISIRYTALVWKCF